MGFKLMAGAVASCALIGVAVGVGIIYGSLLISIGRNPSQRDELLRYAFIGFYLRGKYFSLSSLPCRPWLLMNSLTVKQLPSK